MQDKKKLEELLKYHDNLYYNLDKPEISDEEYDALRKRYEVLTGEYHDKDYVPGEAVNSRIKHDSKILSLDKEQISEKDALRKRIKELLPVVIEPKFDGLTVVRYPNIALTRGNGEYGEDITSKCEAIPGFNNVKPKLYPLRMEAVMLRSEFNRINEQRIKNGLDPFKNPRNAAAGMLRNDDISKVDGLRLFIYDEIGSTSAHSKVLSKLEDTYTNMVTPYKRFTNVDDAMEFIETFNRDELDYDIDGLVVKSDQSNSLIKFGVTGHHPKNAFAIKFEAKGAWTEIIDVDWQVGKTNITPVAILKPVDIDGSTVSRCTLHNYGIMEGLGLTSIDDDNYHKTLVYVIKANDVIPKITKIKRWIDEEWLELKCKGDKTAMEEHKKFPSCYTTLLIPPSACPECEVPTEFTNNILKCTNPECRGKLLNRITHMAGRDALDIEGLSEETTKKILDLYPSIEHPAQVLELTMEQILELPGFAKRSSEKLYNAIQKSRSATIDRVLYAAGLPLVGRSVSKDICKNFTIHDLSQAVGVGNTTYFTSIPGIGLEIAKSLINNWDKMLVPFGDVMLEIQELEVVETKKVDKQLSICVTGSFEGVNRDYFKDLIENAGHKFVKSLSKNTHFLLAGEKAGSKLKKAHELNVLVLTSEEDLLKILK